MGLIVVFISLRAGVKLLIEWQMKEKARKAQILQDSKRSGDV
jgi:simple sugar transport system permease protein